MGTIRELLNETSVESENSKLQISQTYMEGAA